MNNQQAFTPQYVRNLIEANNGHINQNVINVIRQVNNNNTLNDIITAHPWLLTILAPNFANNGQMPYIVELNLGGLPGLPLRYKVLLKPELRGPTEEGAGLRKTKRQKKTKENKWIIHVKTFAKTHKIPYNIALQQAKASYHS